MLGLGSVTGVPRSAFDGSGSGSQSHVSRWTSGSPCPSIQVHTSAIHSTFDPSRCAICSVSGASSSRLITPRPACSQHERDDNRAHALRRQVRRTPDRVASAPAITSATRDRQDRMKHAQANQEMRRRVEIGRQALRQRRVRETACRPAPRWRPSRRRRSSRRAMASSPRDRRMSGGGTAAGCARPPDRARHRADQQHRVRRDARTM